MIVAEHASTRFGGEAILPLHYFRRLRARGIEAWLIVHERTRAELIEILGSDIARVHFVPDTRLHRFLFQLGRPLPLTVSYFTFQRLMRLYSQILARRMARQLIKKHNIDIVHQPIPVSPKESTLMHSLGVPVVIGPMNGGMDYPPGFKQSQPAWVKAIIGVGRMLSKLTNPLFPGKLRAATLLVANERTKNALPRGSRAKIAILVENGVDLSLWTPPATKPSNEKVRFAFSGRLVDWKAVDLLLEAFAKVINVAATPASPSSAAEKGDAGVAATRIPAELVIIGNGPERDALQHKALYLGIEPNVNFLGWVPQAQCPAVLGQADIFVLPSLYECGGAVVLEAMALGLPVIATRWGGPADYLDPTCGILVDPTTPSQFVNDLAAAMKRLAADEPMRRQLGDAGRAKVVREYDWERKIDAIIEHYHDAIALHLQQSQKSRRLHR